MDDFREAHLRHARYYETAMRTANDLYSQGGEALARAMKLFDEERANIQLAQSWAAAKTQEDNEAAKLCSDFPYNGELLVYLRLQARDRIQWGEAALAAAQRIEDPRGSRAYAQAGTGLHGSG
jgi:hypothetical protein